MYGPIPGENLLSDKTNQPWHSPPEMTDINDCLDKIIEKLSDFKVTKSLLALSEIGIPLYRIAMNVSLEGVSAGKWTIDMAILLAGPITKVLEITCENFDIPYDLGIEEEEDNTPTGLFIMEKYAARRGSYKDLGLTNNDVQIIKEDAQSQEQPVQENEDKGSVDMGEQAPNDQDSIQKQGFTKMMGAVQEAQSGGA